jgi:hypothetical protein
MWRRWVSAVLEPNFALASPPAAGLIIATVSLFHHLLL